MATQDNERIDGWREIAAYLARDERTAKRWEKQRGLPVRRIPGEGRANVYLLRREVEAWLNHVSAEMLEADDLPRSLPEAEAAADEDASDHGLLPGHDEAPRATDALTRRDGQIVGSRKAFRLREHVSLLVSASGLALLFVASAMRFFHVGGIESMFFASESHGPQASARLADHQVEEAYLQGVYLCEERTPASLTEARRKFAEVIAADTNFAPAYGGLAETYLLLREYATMPQDLAYREAKKAAQKALQLDANLPEAHAAMGFIDFFAEWKASAAEEEFLLAMRADGGSVLAHHWYGSMLTHQGRYAEALSQLETAQHLRPTSTAILASKSLALGFGGHKEQGMELLRALEGTERDAAVVHRDLALLSLVAPRDSARFVREMKRFAEMRRDPEAIALLTMANEALEREGETAMWLAILRREREMHPGHPTYLMAKAEAMLRHDDRALGLLRRLTEERDPQTIGLVLEPAFQPLHTNAEFGRMAEKLGLLLPVVATR